VVLDRNPVKVDPMAIKDIQVVQTLKEGVLVYNRKPDARAAVMPVVPADQIDRHHVHDHAGVPERPLTDEQKQVLARLVRASE
jgi:hypothetical protein